MKIESNGGWRRLPKLLDIFFFYKNGRKIYISIKNGVNTIFSIENGENKLVLVLIFINFP